MQNNLKYVLTQEGRIVKDGSGYHYEYFLKDHLGNTRVTLDASGTVIQEDAYYPFGMQINALTYQNGVNEENKYLYNGKEMQDEFGLDWYCYGFRFYDFQLGRFPNMDPISDRFNWVSPYNYAENRPVDGVDLWGLQFVRYDWGTALFNPSGYSRYVDVRNAMNDLDVSVTVTAGAQATFNNGSGFGINAASVDLFSFSTDNGFYYLGKDGVFHISQGVSLGALSLSHSFDTKGTGYFNNRGSFTIGGNGYEVSSSSTFANMKGVQGKYIVSSYEASFLLGVRIEFSKKIKLSEDDIEPIENEEEPEEVEFEERDDLDPEYDQQIPDVDDEQVPDVDGDDDPLVSYGDF